MKRFWRITKLRLLHDYKNCEWCGKFTNKIYSIPHIEAGFLVCKQCNK
jgi:ribosome-binding protein aMBF1 (putative translation factor)